MKMIILPIYFILIFVFITTNKMSHAQGTVGKVICYIDTTSISDSNVSLMNASLISDKCTDFVWEGLEIEGPNQTFQIDKNFEYYATDRKFLIGVTHTVESWNYGDPSIVDIANSDLLFFAQVQKTVTNLQGFIFTDLSLKNSEDYASLTANLKTYFSTLKGGNCSSVIGLRLTATELMDYVSLNMSGFNISQFEEFVDIFVVYIDPFISCDINATDNSVTPIGGDTNYTMGKLTEAIYTLDFPDTYKVYLRMNLYGIKGAKEDFVYEKRFEGSYQKKCGDVNGTLEYCFDSGEMLTKKGAVAKDFNGNIAIDSLNFDDILKQCNCSANLPALTYIMDGFEGTTTPNDCPGFTKSCPS